MRTVSFLLPLVALVLLMTACEKTELVQPNATQQPIVHTDATAQHPMPTVIPKRPLADYPDGSTTDLEDVEGAKSTWTLANSWTYVGPKQKWDYIYHISRAELENNDIRVVLTSLNHQSDLYLHAYAPLRRAKGYGLDPNVATTMEVSVDDLEPLETALYFHTYTWTPNTEYSVRIYERPRANVAPEGNDYLYAGQLSNCHTGTGCTPDQWDFCQHSADSWVAWKINQAHRRTVSNYLLERNMNGVTLDEPANWATHLAQLGWNVNQNPRAGAILQWDASPFYPNGHVAYLNEVSASGDLVVTEYNHPNNPCTYSTRIIRIGSRQYPNNFIHVP